MQALYRFGVVLMIWLVTACGAPQAAQPTSAPSVTPPAATLPPPNTTPSTPVAQTPTQAVVPIVVHTASTYLLGGVQAGRWLDAATAALLLKGGERYRILPTQGAQTAAVGQQPTPLDETCNQAYAVGLEPAMSGDAVGVGGTWLLQPQTVRALPTDDPTLVQAVNSFLQSKGIAQPDVRITQAWQTDLEGDGSAETVIAATRVTAQDPTDAAAGDYSVVAVQKNVNGTPTFIEIQGSYFPQAGDFVAPTTYRVLGILDLNGDGTLELVVNGTYYEGTATSAYQVAASAARALLTTRCGA